MIRCSQHATMCHYIGVHNNLSTPVNICIYNADTDVSVKPPTKPYSSKTPCDSRITIKKSKNDNIRYEKTPVKLFWLNRNTRILYRTSVGRNVITWLSLIRISTSFVRIATI